MEEVTSKNIININFSIFQNVPMDYQLDIGVGVEELSMKHY